MCHDQGKRAWMSPDIVFDILAKKEFKFVFVFIVFSQLCNQMFNSIQFKLPASGVKILTFEIFHKWQIYLNRVTYTLYQGGGATVCATPGGLFGPFEIEWQKNERKMEPSSGFVTHCKIPVVIGLDPEEVVVPFVVFDSAQYNGNLLRFTGLKWFNRQDIT